MRCLLATMVVLVCVAISSCVKVRPQVTRRYNSQTSVIVPSGIEARLEVFAMDVPQESARATLLNLSDRGQASLINELGAKTKDSSELLAALGKPIKAPHNPEREVDRTLVQRRVILSIENTSPGP